MVTLIDTLLYFLVSFFFLQSVANVLSSIHMEALDKMPRLAGEIMEDLLATYNVPENKRVSRFCRKINVLKIRNSVFQGSKLDFFRGSHLGPGS